MEKAFDTPHVTFGELLKSKRNELGLTQKAFASQLHLSLGSLINLEHDKPVQTRIPAKTLLALKGVLSIDEVSGILPMNSAARRVLSFLKDPAWQKRVESLFNKENAAQTKLAPATPDSLLLVRGNFYLGRNNIKPDGSKERVSEARFESDLAGPVVAIVPYSSDGNIATGEAQIAPIDDSFSLLQQVMGGLNLPRTSLQAMEHAITNVLKEYGTDIFCNDCKYFMSVCSECPIKALKDKVEEDKGK